MKVLIVEDDPIHQEAAKEQLVDHDLIIMESFVEFFKTFNDCLGSKPKLDLSSFDAVLTDINLPSPHDRKGVEQAATGFVVALKAMQAGVKYIGIITDASHHDDAYGKALDLWIHKPPFKAGGIAIWLECYNAGEYNEDNRLVKNWARLLNGLISA